VKGITSIISPVAVIRSETPEGPRRRALQCSTRLCWLPRKVGGCCPAPPNSSQHSAPDPDYDSLSFAVKNLGFVKLEVLDRSIVQIELHPRNVEFPALLAAQQQISSCGFALFRIRYFETDWKFEISSSAEHTIARLSELCIP
jgi:hypothetical protein